MILDKITRDRVAKCDPVIASLVGYVSDKWEAEMGGQSFVRVSSGLRTEAEQRSLIAKGLSHDEESLHLDGFAVDLIVIEGGRARYDRVGYFRLLALYWRNGMAVLGVKGFQFEWGGDWPSFRDYGHFAIRPATAPVKSLPAP